MSSDLSAKLQLKPDQSLMVMNGPHDHVLELDDISLTNASPASAILLFVTQLADVDSLFNKAMQSLRPEGLLWVAYPKGTSGVVTDINRDKLRLAIVPTGWQSVRQVALDLTWSAMRFRPAEDIGK